LEHAWWDQRRHPPERSNRKTQHLLSKQLTSIARRSGSDARQASSETVHKKQALDLVQFPSVHFADGLGKKPENVACAGENMSFFGDKQVFR
jgi:hypothetical protein